MKFTIVLLCVLLGLIALVEATAIPALEERSPQRNRQCKTSKTHTLSPTESSSSPSSDTAAAGDSKTLADSGKANTGGRGGRGGSKNLTTSADAAAAVDTATATTDAAAAATTDTSASNTDTSSSSTSNNGESTCLAAGAIQTGSQQTGQSGNITAGQVASETDNANFINVCDGQTLTNGKQVITGSCNGIPLGFIPAKTQMPSSLITFPQHNQDIAANQSFDITILTTNMELGHFTNAQLTYYSAPTRLNSAGEIIGHTHISCQDLGGSFTPSAPLDASRFAFFLGINTPADANGQVKATVPNGLPPGFYRCCTLVANSNHSPLQMPVAQRGAQDDCRYFSVGQSAGDASAAAGSAKDTTGGSTTTASSAESAAATSAAATAGGRSGRNRGGRHP